jgi:crotonobetainyl-CoA:carnitine CoA-transferase CaiB-like acyl-CoA transferase
MAPPHRTAAGARLVPETSKAPEQTEDRLRADVTRLLQGVGLPTQLAASVSVRGSDPIYPTRFRYGEAAAVALAAAGSAVAALWKLASGRQQTVGVSVPRAAASLHGVSHLTIDGAPLSQPHLGNPLAAIYPCRDGENILLMAPSVAGVKATLGVLGCGPSKDELRSAVRRWDGHELEQRLAAAGGIATLVLSIEQWRAHPQGKALGPMPTVSVEKIADGAPIDPTSLSTSRRPIGGVRILDLTRMIAGPIIARTLAEQGADVLAVSAPAMEQIFATTIEGHPGKRSAAVNLKAPRSAARLREVLAEADVFVNSYRPGALDALGFGVEEVASARPGIVYVSESCYGDLGPFAERRGFDLNAQAATGLLAADNEHYDRPNDELSRAGAPIDYITGYLGAVGVLAALWRRTDEGGSYHVRVSLCRTAMWVAGMQPRCDPSHCTVTPDITPWLVEQDTAWGRLSQMGPVSELSDTPAQWDRPVAPIGSDRLAWS